MPHVQARKGHTIVADARACKTKSGYAPPTSTLRQRCLTIVDNASAYLGFTL